MFSQFLHLFLFFSTRWEREIEKKKVEFQYLTLFLLLTVTPIFAISAAPDQMAAIWSVATRTPSPWICRNKLHQATRLADRQQWAWLNWIFSTTRVKTNKCILARDTALQNNATIKKCYDVSKWALTHPRRMSGRAKVRNNGQTRIREHIEKSPKYQQISNAEFQTIYVNASGREDTFKYSYA